MTKTATPVRIDGSMGEGGGQVIRTSLALSMLTGQPLQLRKARAGRTKAGLLRQHLTAVRAAAEISGGRASGATLRSKALSFTPGRVRPGTYRFAIGTAGSTALVLQTVLPPLMLADGPSTVTIEGGTHASGAPVFEFLDRAFLPTLERMGPKVSARLESHGFFPAGGGRITVEIEPAERLNPVELHDRGPLLDRQLTAVLAHVPDDVGGRLLSRYLERSGWTDVEPRRPSAQSARSPGAALVAELRYRHVTEVFSTIGGSGMRSEAVADELLKQVRSYLKSPAPVGEYLADQLIVPLALAGGGGFTTRGLSRHATTQLELVRLFLDTRFSQEKLDHGVRVEVDPSSVSWGSAED
ncbi:MAG: RNA 3'-terminal phosphate cyclase [Acidobacteriota bacterium]